MKIVGCVVLLAGLLAVVWPAALPYLGAGCVVAVFVCMAATGWFE